MAVELTLPRQGWSMDEAIFVAWLKNDGDKVEAGEPVFSVETDKAVQEIESLDAGILRYAPAAPQPGDTVRVGDVLGYLLADGEVAPSVQTAPKSEADVVTTAAGASPAVAAAGPPSGPAVRESSAESSRPRGPAGPPVSPRAARRAVREGVDLRLVRGTGREGRIRELDVLAAMKRKHAMPAVPPDTAPLPGRDMPVTTPRRTIAERMHRSQTLTAAVTLTARADAGALVRLRARLKREPSQSAVPAYGDIIMLEVAQALVEHPLFNARWEDDHLHLPDAVNIGFAVDTEWGLVVPVVRDVPGRVLRELAALTRDLAERARLRRLAPEEMTGGTFTITNLGMAGVDAFTPIVNWPECAVLGVGRIAREPVADGERVVVGDRLWLSLTFDHRIADGAPAARFLKAVKGRIEQISE